MIYAAPSFYWSCERNTGNPPSCVKWLRMRPPDLPTRWRFMADGPRAVRPCKLKTEAASPWTGGRKMPLRRWWFKATAGHGPRSGSPIRVMDVGNRARLWSKGLYGVNRGSDYVRVCGLWWWRCAFSMFEDFFVFYVKSFDVCRSNYLLCFIEILMYSSRFSRFITRKGCGVQLLKC